MSRSRKKTPYSGDRKDRGYKRYANKKVRQKLKNSEETYNHKEYKKRYDIYTRLYKALKNEFFEISRL